MILSPRNGKFINYGRKTEEKSRRKESGTVTERER